MHSPRPTHLLSRPGQAGTQGPPLTLPGFLLPPGAREPGCPSGGSRARGEEGGHCSVEGLCSGTSSPTTIPTASLCPATPRHGSGRNRRVPAEIHGLGRKQAFESHLYFVHFAKTSTFPGHIHTAER